MLEQRVGEEVFKRTVERFVFAAVHQAPEADLGTEGNARLMSAYTFFAAFGKATAFRNEVRSPFGCSCTC